MHEGVRGVGALWRKMNRVQKRASTTIERVERRTIRAEVKAARPSKPVGLFSGKIAGARTLPGRFFRGF
jgi:hypothetical protein